MLTLVIDSIHQLCITLLKQRPEILQIIMPLLRPGIRMGQNLYPVISQQRFFIRYPIIPPVLGVGNLFYMKRRIRCYIF